MRSRLIGYVWDAKIPADPFEPSRKTGTVTFVVVRSGTAEAGTWVTERRNVAEDFRRIYGEDPEDAQGHRSRSRTRSLGFVCRKKR